MLRVETKSLLLLTEIVRGYLRKAEARKLRLDFACARGASVRLAARTQLYHPRRGEVQTPHFKMGRRASKKRELLPTGLQKYLSASGLSDGLKPA